MSHSRLTWILNFITHFSQCNLLIWIIYIMWQLSGYIINSTIRNHQFFLVDPIQNNSEITVLDWQEILCTKAFTQSFYINTRICVSQRNFFVYIKIYFYSKIYIYTIRRSFIELSIRNIIFFACTFWVVEFIANYLGSNYFRSFCQTRTKKNWLKPYKAPRYDLVKYLIELREILIRESLK